MNQIIYVESYLLTVKNLVSIFAFYILFALSGYSLRKGLVYIRIFCFRGGDGAKMLKYMKIIKNVRLRKSTKQYQYSNLSMVNTTRNGTRYIKDPG